MGYGLPLEDPRKVRGVAGQCSRGGGGRLGGGLLSLKSTA